MKELQPNRTQGLGVSPMIFSRIFSRNRRLASMAKRIVTEESGQALPWVVLGMMIMVGASALAVDVAHALVAQRQLQDSADAAALAAAETLPGSNYATVGQTFDGAGNNANKGVTLTSINFTPLCSSTVKSWGVFCSTSGGAVTFPNAVQVNETATISTYFAGIFGVRTLTINAESTAAKGLPVPYNVAVIVDSTLSMAESDSNCVINGSTVSQMTCALNGIQQLLTNLNPQYDRVALFTFPNVATGSSAGVVTGQTAGVDNSGTYNCTTPIPSKNGTVSYPNISPYGYLTLLDNPNSSPKYLLPWSGDSWAMPYSFPPIPTNTSGYTVPTGNNAPTYEVVGFSTDYNTQNSNGTYTLNTSSNLVKAVGGNSSCGGIEPSNYDGNYGTYYAGALYAAQAALLAEQPNNPKSGNVIIVLGDGNSTAPSASSSPESSSPAMPTSQSTATTTYSTATSLAQMPITFPSGYMFASTSGNSGGDSYPSWNGECGQAVTAAQYAATYPAGKSTNATLVYTIAYGALTKSGSGSNAGCASDASKGSNPNITPCQTLQKMATISPTGKYFYSDWAAQGGSSSTGCKATDSNNAGVTAIAQIYQAIAGGLSGTRLIPNGTP